MPVMRYVRLLLGTVVAFMGSVLAVFGQAPPYETTKITEGVYQFRYRFHNGLFVVGNDAVLAVDPISVEAAKIYVQEIKKITSKPIRYLVYSHNHYDHITGGAAFGQMEIIAHEKAREKLAILKNPNIPLPTATFTDRKVIDLGGKAIELIYPGRSHSDNLIVVYLPQDKILFTVDIVSHRSVGFMDLPDSYFPDWLGALNKVNQLDFETLLFGHGPPGKREIVRENIEYYTDLMAEVKKLVDQRLSLDEVKQKISLPKYSSWGGYKESLPLNAERLYWHFRLGW